MTLIIERNYYFFEISMRQIKILVCDDGYFLILLNSINRSGGIWVF